MLTVRMKILPLHEQRWCWPKPPLGSSSHLQDKMTQHKKLDLPPMDICLWAPVKVQFHPCLSTLIIYEVYDGQLGHMVDQQSERQSRISTKSQILWWLQIRTWLQRSFLEHEVFTHKLRSRHSAQLVWNFVIALHHCQSDLDSQNVTKVMFLIYCSHKKGTDRHQPMKT